jgi:hypothetical protein
LANYDEALRNQQESIRLQQVGLRQVRVIFGFATAALLLAVAMLVMLLLRVVARYAVITGGEGPGAGICYGSKHHWEASWNLRSHHSPACST